MHPCFCGQTSACLSVCRHCLSETPVLLGYTFGNTCSNIKSVLYMPVTIHFYINKIRLVDIYIYMININIMKQLGFMMYVNPLVGICIGCEYAYTCIASTGLIFACIASTRLILTCIASTGLMFACIASTRLILTCIASTGWCLHVLPARGWCLHVVPAHGWFWLALPALGWCLLVLPAHGWFWLALPAWSWCLPTSYKEINKYSRSFYIQT